MAVRQGAVRAGDLDEMITATARHAEPYMPPNGRITRRTTQAVAEAAADLGRRETIRDLADLHARALDAEARRERAMLRAAMRRAARWQKLADEHPGDTLLIAAGHLAPGSKPGRAA